MHKEARFRPRYWRVAIEVLVLVALTAYYIADRREDPNDRGYDAIRRAFLLQMIRVLAQDRPAATAAR